MQRDNEWQERQDYRAARVCSIIAEVNRNPKKRRKPFQPREFMPQYKKQSGKQTPDQLLQNIQLMNAAMGGEVK